MTKKFIFGSATAAFQCEGNLTKDGRGKSTWDDTVQGSRAVAKYDPETASDFYNRYEEDFRLAKEFGIKSIRISLPWSRLFPKNNEDLNQKAVEHYHKLFKTMKRYAIEPNVTLHHIESPMWLVDEGDFSSKNAIKKFKKYAEFCFKEFEEVEMWATINEISAYTESKFIKKTIPPYMENEFGHLIYHMHNMNLAHAEAVISFKELKIKGQIGMPNWNNIFLPVNEKEGSKLAADKANAVYNWFTMEAALLGKYRKETLDLVNQTLSKGNWQFQVTLEELDTLKRASKLVDWFGINYYMTSFVAKPDDETKLVLNSTGEKGKIEANFKDFFKLAKKEGVLTTKWDWPIYPSGLKLLIEQAAKVYNFKKPIYITENGFGEIEERPKNGEIIKDIYRIEYIQLHLNAIQELIDDGIDVAGYYVWSHMDMLSWANGYNKRYGLFFVDYKTQERIPKLSAHWWKEKAETGSLLETDDAKKWKL